MNNNVMDVAFIAARPSRMLKQFCKSIYQCSMGCLSEQIKKLEQH